MYRLIPSPLLARTGCTSLVNVVHVVTVANLVKMSNKVVAKHLESVVLDSKCMSVLLYNDLS